MKSNTPEIERKDNHSKRDFVVILAGWVIISLSTYVLCVVMKLYNVVLLTTSVIGILNAIYYGIIRKDLKRSLRLGFAIFFLGIGFVGFLLYRLSLQGDKVPQLGMAFLAQFFVLFVLAITFVFIYKHRTLSFWNWV